METGGKIRFAEDNDCDGNGGAADSCKVESGSCG